LGDFELQDFIIDISVVFTAVKTHTVVFWIDTVWSGRRVQRYILPPYQYSLKMGTACSSETLVFK
jgi:hypothetical protein